MDKKELQKAKTSQCMKHLKKFNESFTQTDIDEILDMFQEIADEYNISKRESIGYGNALCW